MKKAVLYAIYKRQIDMPWPGEFWEDCRNLAEAKRRLREAYGNGDVEDEKDVFRIVRTELTIVRPKKSK